MTAARACRMALLSILVLPAPPAPAAPKDAGRGEKYALLIGVRKYDPNELRSLPYSEPDVVTLADVLRQRGYRPGNVVLMTQTAGAEDTRFLPTASNIRRELALTLRDLEEGDSVLVALAGHGVQSRGDPENYSCPADARLADKASLIPLGAIYRELEASGAGLKLLLVDACRNDPQSENSRARSVVNLESVTRPQAAKPQGGVVAFFSCSEGEKAYEHSDLKHGVFFHFVIAALKGEAAGPGDSEVLIPDLEKYVKRRVRDFVREKYGVRQMPELRGTSRDLVPLVTIERRSPRIKNSVGMTLARIPAGEFLMDSGDDDKDAEADEKPRHRVRITRAVYLGTTEVTVGQFRAVLESSGYRTEAERDGKGGYGWDEEKGIYKQDPKYTWRNPGFAQTDDHPVVIVSWDDAVAFCNVLSEREGLAPHYRPGSAEEAGGDGYRLPTEAEWEYACRAGTRTRFASGDDPETLANVGNVADAAAKARYPGWTAISARDGFVYTAPVGRFRPNKFGLYDMHGNVWEWCGDGYSADYYKQSPGVDPPGPLLAHGLRVMRGGGWFYAPRAARSASRRKVTPDFRDHDLGFRVARVQSS